MAELRALVWREWALSRRWLAVLGALTLLGYGVVFALCMPSDRYRLLCDPVLTRRVALTAALAAGGALAFRSFAHEIRSHTWDQLLLLPVSRGAVVGAKLAFGALALGALTLGPLLALRALVALSPAPGGPVLTVPELFAHSILGVSALVGSLAYAGGASAALLLRAGQRAFWAPLAPAALLYFSLSGDRQVASFTPGRAAVALAFVAAALAHGLGEARESGRAPSGALRALRALAVTPIVMAALAFAGSLAGETVSHRRAASASREGERARRPRPLSFDRAGRVGRHARAAAQSRFSLEPPGEPVERGDRYWSPAFLSGGRQYFLDHARNVFWAYDDRSGEPRGCVGRDGLRARDCAEFATRPAIEQFDGVLAIERDRVWAFDPSRGRFDELFRGRVDRVARVSVDMRLALAVQSGDALVWIAPVEPDADSERDSADDEPSDRAVYRVEVVCRGLAPFGAPTGVSLGDGWVGLATDGPGRGEETLLACRGGAVTEHQTQRLDDDGFEVPPRPLSDVLASVAFGPAVSAAMLESRHYRFAGGTARDRPLTRAPRWGVAALAAIALVVARVARGARPDARTLASALPAVVLGPAYALAWLAVAAAPGRAARRGVPAR